jgi:hypothetical protein
MRPWLQPALYVAVISLLQRLGVVDPFAWATVLRALSGLAGWGALLALALCCRVWFDDDAARRTAVRMLSTFCVLPFFLVRTSSESLSTSSFYIALALFTLGAPPGGNRPRATLAVVGLLLGLAFEFRYPVGLMVAGWVAWAAWVRRVSWRELATVATGLLAVLAAAAAVDRWGYGEWTFPAWNFVAENLRGGRSAEQFGALPPWGYLLLLVHTPFAPAAVPAALATVGAWVRHPRHVLTWTGVPMVLVHSLIAHKELRFFIPLAPAAAVAFGLAVAPGRDGLEPLARVLRGPRARRLRKALFAANGAALLVLSLVPPSPTVALQRFVHRELPRPSELLVLGPGSPWGPGGLIGRFYRPPEVQVRPVTPGQLRQRLRSRPCFVTTRETLQPGLLGPPGTRCTPLFRSVPPVLDRVPGIRAQDRWTLYSCHPPPAGGP